VRVREVVGAWLAREPRARVALRATAPAWLFPEADGRMTIDHVASDVGMVQPHGLAIDFGATLAALDRLEAGWDRRVAREAEWLRSIGADLVVGDVPPLAFAAAERARVPSVALANFSWDWIYGWYAQTDSRFAPHARRAAQCYETARLLLRVPLYADMPAFRDTQDIGLIARRCPLSRDEARRSLGLPDGRPIVLLSFGGLGFRGIDAAGLAELSQFLFVATEPFASSASNLVAVERRGLDYTALLRAADVVLTKPGYGIVAASLVNGVRVLYTTREDFPETPILVRALEEHATAALVARADLRRGAIRAPLEALLDRPLVASRLPADGAERAAQAIAREAGL
jgi:hypothetical protein